MRTAIALLTVTILAPSAVRAQQVTPAPSVSLHAAAFQGDVDAVRQHVRAGTDLDAKDAYGSTPLVIATPFEGAILQLVGRFIRSLPAP